MHGALREHHRLQQHWYVELLGCHYQLHLPSRPCWWLWDSGSQRLMIRYWEAKRWLLHILLEYLDGGKLGVRGAAQFQGPGAGPEGETPEARLEFVFSVASQLHA